jgi:hypothetical protein
MAGQDSATHQELDAEDARDGVHALIVALVSAARVGQQLRGDLGPLGVRREGDEVGRLAERLDHGHAVCDLALEVALRANNLAGEVDATAVVAGSAVLDSVSRGHVALDLLVAAERREVVVLPA